MSTAPAAGRVRRIEAARHPQIGDLDLRYETFTVNTPDQQPVVYQASPSSSADDAFNRAAS